MNEWLESIDGNRYIIHIGAMLKLFLQYIWLIILATLLFGGGAYAYSAYCITPLYQSSIKMYVNNSTNVSDATSITSSDITASQYLVETYAVVLTSKPTLNAVIEQTGVDYTYSELSSMISTSAINDTEVFQVTVTGPDPIETAEIANAIADVAPEQIMDIVSGSSVKIVEYADIAAYASSPDKSRYALMGAMLGFLLSCGGILLFSMLRNGMSVEEKVRRDFKDRAVLSVIPLMGKKTRGKHRHKDEEEDADLCDQLNFAAAEAYKLLRENVFFCLSDVPDCKVIGVTSSVRSEGKTTTSINLAYTLAQANKKVCLIDCDFRIPSVAKSMDLRPKPGMTNFLAGQVEGSKVMLKCTYDTAKFYTIPAGDVPPNPSELLGSKRMRDSLSALGMNFDYLILDLPPIGIVSDALATINVIDGMLFAVREDFYDRRILREAMRTLDGVNATILGMVVTHSTTQEKEYKRYGGKYAHKYGYQYGYGYGYGYGENAAAHPKAEHSPKTERSSKVVQTPKTEHASKVVQAPKTEHASKAAQVPKIEHTSKAAQAPKVESASEANLDTQQQEASQ